MDPNATLDELRELVDGILGAAGGVPGDVLTDADVDAIAVADAFQSLDKWLSEGGFLPTAWAKSTARQVEGGS